MPACLHPLPAWRTPGGVTLREPLQRDHITEAYRLPCGGCLACRANKARDWAIRCQLELKDHNEACWVTLTYSDDMLPLTLQKPDLSAWLKRLRARHQQSRSIRFFASGEYGERTQRPHYHAILFGLSDDPSIQDTWQHGHVQVDELTPASIAYVAGYTSKKIGWKLEPRERSDPETGECYTWQPPFIHMSRRPGIASSVRDNWLSWRKTAIYNGRSVPVPQFLHQAFRNNASVNALDNLKTEKDMKHLTPLPSTATIDYWHDRLQAEKAILIAKHDHQSSKRDNDL